MQPRQAGAPTGGAVPESATGAGVSPEVGFQQLQRVPSRSPSGPGSGNPRGAAWLVPPHVVFRVLQLTLPGSLPSNGS